MRLLVLVVVAGCGVATPCESYAQALCAKERGCGMRPDVACETDVMSLCESKPWAESALCVPELATLACDTLVSGHGPVSCCPYTNCGGI